MNLDFNKMDREELTSWIGRDIYYYDMGNYKTKSSKIDGFILEEDGGIRPVSDGWDGFNYCDYANEDALYFASEYECETFVNNTVTEDVKRYFGIK